MKFHSLAFKFSGYHFSQVNALDLLFVRSAVSPSNKKLPQVPPEMQLLPTKINIGLNWFTLFHSTLY